MQRFLPLSLATAMLGLAIGSAVAQPAPPPYTRVPPPRVEHVPPPPGQRFIWEPGHWQWNGRQYVWMGGHYVRRGQFREYAPGSWVWAPRLGRWEWVGAHWRR